MRSSCTLTVNANGGTTGGSLLFVLLPLVCKLLLLLLLLMLLLLLLLLLVLLLFVIAFATGFGDGDRGDFRSTDGLSSDGNTVCVAYGADGLSDDSRFIV